MDNRICDTIVLVQFAKPNRDAVAVIQSKQNWQRNVACLLSSQAVSMIGTMLVQYAIVWHMTLATNSGLIVGLMSCFAVLPMTLVMPFAGVFADRHNRKNMVMIADASVALATLLMAVVLFLNGESNDTVLLILLVVIVRSLGQGFQMPAASAIVPQVTPEAQLVRINGMYQTMQAIMSLGCPALAVVLLGFLPLAGILLIDVVTAIIGIGMMFFLVKVANIGESTVNTPSKESSDSQIEAAPATTNTEDARGGVWAEMKSGLKYIKTHPILIAILIAGFAIQALAAPAAMLSPLQITRNFGDALWQLSVAEIAFGAGMLAGGVLMGVWGGFKDKIRTIAVGILAMAIGCIIMGVAPNFWIYTTSFAMVGIAVTFGGAPTMAIIQSITDEKFMGRVMSIVNMALGIAMPIAILAFGPLGDIININYIMIATGVIMLVPIVWLLKAKVFRI